jgi:hypothetical protein
MQSTRQKEKIMKKLNKLALLLSAIFLLLVISFEARGAAFVVENNSDQDVFCTITVIISDLGPCNYTGFTVYPSSIYGTSNYREELVYRIYCSHTRGDVVLVDRWVEYPSQYSLQWIYIDEEKVKGTHYEALSSIQNP